MPNDVSRPKEIFDRQGLLIRPQAEKQSYDVDLYVPIQLQFQIIRPSGFVSLREAHVLELCQALDEWLKSQKIRS